MVDTVEAAPIQCSNPECQVSESGKCIEGQPLTECSHYGKPVVIVERTSPGSSGGPWHVPGVRLPDAEAFSAVGANTILRNQPTLVVALVGPKNSGKTSLIGGVYDLLMVGPIGEFKFAGSSTLHSFERVCHDSRSASQRKKPYTERTEHGDATYFHLDLVGPPCGGKRAALFANRAGEQYMATHGDPEHAQEFAELRRADTLTLLADGAKLIDDAERHLVREDIFQSLLAFREAGQTRKWQRVALVLTKLDEVKSHKKSGRALGDFEQIAADVRKEFGEDFADIKTFEVAAYPVGDGATRGEGIVALLTYWMSEPSRLQVPAVAPLEHTPLRAFGRLRIAEAGVQHE